MSLVLKYQGEAARNRSEKIISEKMDNKGAISNHVSMKNESDNDQK